MRICFNDLNFEKQEEIREWIKDEVLGDLNNETIEKGITFDELLRKNYDVGYDLTDEEKTRHWKILVENFLDERIEDKLNGWYCEASWR